MVKTYKFRGREYLVSCIEDADPQPHPSWYSFEDESTVRDETWRIQPGDIVFDVGAAYGSYTLTALSAGAAYVYAWSPPQAEPSEPSLLRESLALNEWEDHCEVIETGVYSETGWLNANTLEFIGKRPAEKSHDVIQVDRLDANHYAMTGPRTWLKLDVEGAEVEVLRGAERLIEARRPIIQVENHLFKRASIEQEVREFLLAKGYREVQTRPYHSVSHSLYEPK